MARIIALLFLSTILSTGSAFAAGICICEPGISGTINGYDILDQQRYPDALQRVNLGAAGYSLDLEINDPAFVFSLVAETNPDPAIGFGLRISGDPVVDITITQVFLGGPYPNLFASTVGSLTDGLNGTLGNGAASLTDAYIRTSVFGSGGLLSPQGELNFALDCAFASQSLYFQASIPCSPQAESLSFDASAGGILQVKIHFNLSDFDAVAMNSTSVISAAVPEPGTSALLAAGLLALAGYAWRRKGGVVRSPVEIQPRPE